MLHYFQSGSVQNNKTWWVNSYEKKHSVHEMSWQINCMHIFAICHETEQTDFDISLNRWHIVLSIFCEYCTQIGLKLGLGLQLALTRIKVSII